MLQRTAVALVGIPVLVAVVWWGAPWLTFFVLLVAVQGVNEAYRMLPSGIGPLPLLLGAAWVVSFVLGAQSSTGPSNFLLISAGILGAGAFLGLLWMIAFYSQGQSRKAFLYLIGGPLYVGFLLAHAIALRDFGGTGPFSMDLGRDWLLVVLVLVFATDTGAFLVGRSLGRHRMAPVISPGKTWEGAAGGLVWALVAAMLLGLAFDLEILWWQQALIGATVGVISQCGDLFESKLKRLSNVKDAGSIIPGHGGVLDRLDSILVSIPAVYYLLVTVFKP